MRVIFSRNHQPKRPRLLPFFMLMPRGFVRRNFIDHHGWNGQESATIFLPPCALAYDVMSFCVDANITTGEFVRHLLITLNVCHKVSAPYSLWSRCDVCTFLRSLLEAWLFKSSLSIML